MIDLSCYHAILTMYLANQKYLNIMTNQPVGYLRMEDQEEFEAWERSEVKRREQESNDAIKALKAKNGKDYFAPDYNQQEASFRNTNAFNY